MSFAYLPLFTGDYLRDTRHLTPMRHGVFLLLLMHCWDQKGPLPLDEQECAGIANCRSADEIEGLRYVIGKYFIKMEDGHYNRRMQIEVEKSENISSARSEAGKKGYEAKAKQLLSKSQASASIPIPTLSPSLPPSPIEEKPPTRKRAASPVERPDDVDSQTWDDWLALRKQKRAVVSPTVLSEARAEASKALLTLQRFLAIWCMRGSQGLQADWLTSDERGKPKKIAASFRAQDEASAKAKVSAWTGGLLGRPETDYIDMENDDDPALALR